MKEDVSEFNQSAETRSRGGEGGGVGWYGVGRGTCW